MKLTVSMGRNRYFGVIQIKILLQILLLLLLYQWTSSSNPSVLSFPSLLVVGGQDMGGVETVIVDGSVSFLQFSLLINVTGVFEYSQWFK